MDSVSSHCPVGEGCNKHEYGHADEGPGCGSAQIVWIVFHSMNIPHPGASRLVPGCVTRGTSGPVDLSSETSRMSKTDLPEFVIDGTFEDVEWRSAISTQEGKRSKAQERASVFGPKRHPYGANAFRDDLATDGVVRWFPDRDSRDRWFNQHMPTAQRAAPSPVEAGVEQVEATRTAIESAEKVAAGAGKGPVKKA
jgi:hypothetical protein